MKTFAVSALLLLAACHVTESTSTSSTSSSTAAAAVAFDPQKFDQFGAGVDSADAVPVERVLAAPQDFVGKSLRLRGPVQSVCQTKGCWMRIGGDPNVFVKFKDYGFFVPLDAEGRDAILEGELAIKEQSVAERRHYLEDAGKYDEAAKVTEPLRTVTFMATGVALAKR
ncbi:MAG: DUF4920 domain-containing protein [Planctomycetota bacterium]